MKKIYLSPAIQTLEIRSMFAICDPSPGDPNKGIDDGMGGSMFGGGGAPQRKPF